MKNRYKYLAASVAPVILAATIIALLFVFRGADSKEIELKLVIDHDGGADDAMAIFMAVLYEKHFQGPKLVALTTTHGNIDEHQVYINSQRILDIAERRDVPIYRGSSQALIENIQSDYYFGNDGLGDNKFEEFESIPAEKEKAALALIEQSKKYEGNLIVLAIGSLTNIALAVQIDPQFIGRLSQLYVAAGYIPSDKFVDAEFNAAMDAEAYRIVARNGHPDKLTLIPFSQILLYQNVTNDWRINVLGEIPTKIMKYQNSFERVSLNLTSYWCLLDPSAMGIVLSENTIVEETRYADSSIHLCGDSRGITTYNFTSVNNSTARIIDKVMKEPYTNILYEIFSADQDNKQ